MFITKLNVVTGKNYRLPTEAEWEFAARGGNKSKGYKYSGSNDLNAVAWYGANSGNQAHPVGTKAPNELGIYDMSGNVREWCNNWYDEEYYSYSPQNNPQGPDTGSERVLRNGGFHNAGIVAYKVSTRGKHRPQTRNGDMGFRLVLP